MRTIVIVKKILTYEKSEIFSYCSLKNLKLSHIGFSQYGTIDKPPLRLTKLWSTSESRFSNDSGNKTATKLLFMA